MRHLHLACVSLALTAPACGTQSLYLGERLSADAATDSGAGGSAGLQTGTSTGGADPSSEGGGGGASGVGIGGDGGARIVADGGTHGDAWASASVPKATAVNGGALQAIAHGLLSSPQPLVTSVAVAPREGGAMVVLAEGEGSSPKRLTVRRAQPGASGPDLSEIWGKYDAPVQQPWGHLSAAALGAGMAVYYQETPATALRQGLLRFDGAGSLVQGPDDPALPASAGAPLCGLTADTDRVLLVCASGSSITLRACPAVGACSEPTRISANATSSDPPSPVVTDEGIQFFYEELAPKRRLRRTLVDKATLAVLSHVDLLDLPTLGAHAGFQGTVPAAIRIDAGVLVAFDFPRQFGVWDTQSKQLRLSVPDASKDDWGVFWVTGRSFSSLATLQDSIYLLENTSLGQLDQSLTKTQLIRINPETLGYDVVAEVDHRSAWYSDARGAGAIVTDPVGLALVSVAEGALPSYHTHLLPGVYDVSPQGITCDASHCQALLSQPWMPSDGSDGHEWGIWSVDRATGRVTAPTATVHTAGGSPGRLLSATTDRVVIAAGPDLEIFKEALATPVSIAAGTLDIVAAFPETSGLRVFSYTDQPNVIEHRWLAADGSLSAPVASDPVFAGDLFGCDGSYFTLVADDDQHESIWRLRPAVSPHSERVGGFAGESFHGNDVHCSGDAMFLLREVFEEGVATPDYFVVVRRLDGTPVAQVALPKGAEPAGSQAVGGALYLLWKAASRTDILGLTFADSSGRAAQFELPLPSGKSLKATGSLEVAVESEVRLVWTAEDGSPFASIWRLPME